MEKLSRAKVESDCAEMYDAIADITDDYERSVAYDEANKVENKLKAQLELQEKIENYIFSTEFDELVDVLKESLSTLKSGCLVTSVKTSGSNPSYNWEIPTTRIGVSMLEVKLEDVISKISELKIKS